MQNKAYDQGAATRILPLLNSISEEIQERKRTIRQLEELAEALGISPSVHGEEILELQSQTATHKRELRHAMKELEALGCSVASTEPLTINIPSLSGRRNKGFSWCPGDTIVRLHPADSAA